LKILGLLNIEQVKRVRCGATWVTFEEWFDGCQ